MLSFYMPLYLYIILYFILWEQKPVKKTLKKIWRFLTRQGIPPHGDGYGNNSNFAQNVPPSNCSQPCPFHMVVKENKQVRLLVIQNEKLKVMVLEVPRDVAASLHSSTFY